MEKPLYIRSYGQLPPTLFDPDLKRQWAKNHLDELARRCSILQQTHAPITTAEEDLHNGFYVIRTKHASIDASMFEAVLVVGDFVANLRGCLDHLAWKLVSLNGKTPDTNTSFPICETDNSSGRKYIAKCTAGMSDSAVALVKEMQPYHARNDYRSTHLWILNKLWNIDKHRHLVPHTVISGWQIRTTGIKPLSSEVVDHCTIMLFPLARKNEVQFNPNPEAQFRLLDREDDINVGFDDLSKIYEYVANTLLPAFAGLMSQPSASGQTI